MKIADINRCMVDICKEVFRDINWVNSGGCAVYAIELANALQSIGQTEVYFRTYDWRRNPVNVSDVEKNAFNGVLPSRWIDWERNGVSLNHVRLEWNGTLWDALDGAVPLDDAKTWCGDVLQEGHISFKALQKLTRKGANWNSQYSRKQTPKMREIIEKHFKKLVDSYTSI